MGRNYPRHFAPSNAPLGQIGSARISEYTVTTEDEERQKMRLFNPSTMGRYVPAGTYKALHISGEMMMSDTPDEARDQRAFVSAAEGRCLVHGLGLGWTVEAILRKQGVEHVTVVEINPDVIALVGPMFNGDARVKIINDDALTWAPPPSLRWKAVWHDIWPTICADNLNDMKRLHRRFGRRAEWQGSWAREYLT